MKGDFLLASNHLSSSNDQNLATLSSKSALERQLGFDSFSLSTDSDLNSATDYSAGIGIDFLKFEHALNDIRELDPVLRTIFLSLLRSLIIIINSIVGLSLTKLAKSYFGLNICYVLLVRLACLVRLAVISTTNSQNEPTSDTSPTSDSDGFVTKIKRISSKLPVSGRTLIKVLLILAYTQLLLQQLDNRKNLEIEADMLSVSSSSGGSSWFLSSDHESRQPTTTCCGGSKLNERTLSEDEGKDGNLAAWFDCMWTSAKACTASQPSLGRPLLEGKSRATRFLELLSNLLNQILAYHLRMAAFVWDKLGALSTLLWAIWTNWYARWRSPIIQRLAQSMLVQILYVGSLLLTPNDQQEQLL